MVVVEGMAESLLGLADPVLDTVLVQDQPLGRGLVAAVLLQEDPQGVAQPGVLVVVSGTRGGEGGGEDLGSGGMQEGAAAARLSRPSRSRRHRSPSSR
jgi:hypothetical protein